MVSHKEFTAWIMVAGRQVTEYAIEAEPDGRKVTCYIPSIPGQRFEVHWRDNGSKVFTASYIVLDGFTTPGRYLHGRGETKRTGVRAGPNTERPFIFAEIPKHAYNLSAGVNPKDIGTIVLQIAQVQRGPNRPPNQYQILPATIPNDFASITGGRCVTYAKEEVPCPEQFPVTWTSKPLDAYHPHSYVKFIWKYRPIEFLRENGISKLLERPVLLTRPPGSASAPQPKRRRRPGPPLIGSQRAGPNSAAASSFVISSEARGGYSFLTPAAPPPPTSYEDSQHPLFTVPVSRSSSSDDAMEEDSPPIPSTPSRKGKEKMVQPASPSSGTTSVVESGTGGVPVTAAAESISGCIRDDSTGSAAAVASSSSVPSTSTPHTASPIALSLQMKHRPSIGRSVPGSSGGTTSDHNRANPQSSSVTPILMDLSTPLWNPTAADAEDMFNYIDMDGYGDE